MVRLYFPLIVICQAAIYSFYMHAIDLLRLQSSGQLLKKYSELFEAKTFHNVTHKKSWRWLSVAQVVVALLLTAVIC